MDPKYLNDPEICVSGNIDTGRTSGGRKEARPALQVIGGVRWAATIQ
jgi:hypothetical protein